MSTKTNTKYPPVKHTFTVDQSRWVHGTKTDAPEKSALKVIDDAFLEDKSAVGKMCCLGFLGKSCGVRVSAMEGVTYPSDVYYKDQTEKFKKLILENGFDLPVITEIVSLNDDAGITLTERKKRLRHEFRLLGIAVNFVPGKTKKASAKKKK